MLKFWILALVGLVSLAAGATKSEASAEKDVPAAIKNEAVKAPVTFTSSAMRILAKARLIQTKISGKHKAESGAQRNFWLGKNGFLNFACVQRLPLHRRQRHFKTPRMPRIIKSALSTAGRI